MNPIQIFGSTVELNCFTFAVTQYGEKIIPNAAIIQEVPEFQFHSFSLF